MLWSLWASVIQNFRRGGQDVMEKIYTGIGAIISVQTHDEWCSLYPYTYYLRWFQYPVIIIINIP